MILFKNKKSIKKKFDQIYDLIILYVIGNFENIKKTLWNMLKNFRKLGETKFNKIMTNKIDYCVIYSIQCDNVILNALYNKINRDTSDIYDNEIKNFENNDYTDYGGNNISLKDKIISFYFFFICLEDDIKNSYLENSDIVNW